MRKWDVEYFVYVPIRWRATIWGSTLMEAIDLEEEKIQLHDDDDTAPPIYIDGDTISLFDTSGLAKRIRQGIG